MKSLLESKVKVLVMLVAMAALSGCGGSSVLIVPDPKNSELHIEALKRDSVRIVSVKDERSSRNAHIGIARVGMMNREVPYLIKGGLLRMVKSFLDTLIVGRHDEKLFLPVTVAIDSFEVGEKTKVFGEEGYFSAMLRFSYPVTADSFASQIVASNQTDISELDVTNKLEPLIYKGMAEMARKFVEGTLDRSAPRMMIAADSLGSFIERDSLRQTPERLPVVVPGPISQNAKVDSTRSSGVAFQFFAGKKITTGVRASYCMLSRAGDSNFHWGVAVGLTICDIDNKPEHLKGSFFNGGGWLLGKYYLLNSTFSPFVAVGVGLSTGSESIDYGDRTESSFFFGAIAQESVGISISRKVSLEFGAFQLALSGSNLLPTDIGLLAGLSIGV